MFSSHVIMAIEVLLFLEFHGHDLHGEPPKRGKDVSLLRIDGEIHQHILRSVLRKLVMGKYILWTSRTKEYVLLKSPEQITVLSLIQLFHGDICIGQLYNHYQVLGYEKLRSVSYQRFLEFEKGLYAQLQRQLGDTPITNFHPESFVRGEVLPKEKTAAPKPRGFASGACTMRLMEVDYSAMVISPALVGDRDEGGLIR